jgi:hypothetical protein
VKPVPLAPTPRALTLPRSSLLRRRPPNRKPSRRPLLAPTPHNFPLMLPHRWMPGEFLFLARERTLPRPKTGRRLPRQPKAPRPSDATRPTRQPRSSPSTTERQPLRVPRAPALRAGPRGPRGSLSAPGTGLGYYSTKRGAPILWLIWTGGRPPSCFSAKDHFITASRGLCGWAALIP